MGLYIESGTVPGALPQADIASALWAWWREIRGNDDFRGGPTGRSYASPGQRPGLPNRHATKPQRGGPDLQEAQRAVLMPAQGNALGCRIGMPRSPNGAGLIFRRAQRAALMSAQGNALGCLKDQARPLVHHCSQDICTDNQFRPNGPFLRQPGATPQVGESARTVTPKG